MNSFLSSVRKIVPALAIAALVGCGEDDGLDALADGKAAYEVRDLKKAEKLFEESLACAPRDVDRLVCLTRVKLDLGELPAAQDLIQKAAALAPDAEDVLLLQAQIAWHAKDYEAAAKGFSALAADVKREASVRAQGWTGYGIVKMAGERPHLARTAFLQALRLDRSNAAAWYHLGLLYRDGFGYPQAALEQFEIFVRLEASASPRVQKVQRAIIPALKEAVVRALAEQPGASKRDSSACAAAIVKAEAAWKKGDYRGARQNYQAAATADALSYPALLGLARAWQKTDASPAGQAKALEFYKRACSLRPSAVSTFLQTGTLAARLGFHAQAVEIYSRAVAANPASLEALDGLIRALRKAGRNETSAKAYQDYRATVASKSKKAKK